MKHCMPSRTQSCQRHWARCKPEDVMISTEEVKKTRWKQDGNVLVLTLQYNNICQVLHGTFQFICCSQLAAWQLFLISVLTCIRQQFVLTETFRLFGFAHLQYALGGDSLGDGSGDALWWVDESLLGGHSLLDVATEESLHNGVDSSEQDASLTVDIGLLSKRECTGRKKRIKIMAQMQYVEWHNGTMLVRSVSNWYISLRLRRRDKTGSEWSMLTACPYLVLLSHGRFEHEGGSKCDSPGEGEVSGAATDVLVNGEWGVDSCTLLGFAL